MIPPPTGRHPLRLVRRALAAAVRAVWAGLVLALLLVQGAGLAHRTVHPAPHWHAGLTAAPARDDARAPHRAALPGSHDEATCRLLDALGLADAGLPAAADLLPAASPADPGVPTTPACREGSAPWRPRARGPPAVSA